MTRSKIPKKAKGNYLGGPHIYSPPKPKPEPTARRKFSEMSREFQTTIVMILVLLGAGLFFGCPIYFPIFGKWLGIAIFVSAGLMFLWNMLYMIMGIDDD